MVGSRQRADFARASLAELQERLEGRFAHVVVDDPPRCRGKLLGIVPARLTALIPNLSFYGVAREIYASAKNLEFIPGGAGSSSEAVLTALARARQRGRSYVFIHLDDNAYSPDLSSLLRASIAAMDALPELNLVRLSAYPILTAECTSERGNMSLCAHAGDAVRFDAVTLRPVRHDEFTAWIAPWAASTADGRFWPIMLWNAVYRIEFLQQLLSDPAVRRLPGLGHVESRYKTHWHALWRTLPGAFGFINMQFAGLERERNANWRELIALPNRPVR